MNGNGGKIVISIVGTVMGALILLLVTSVIANEIRRVDEDKQIRNELKAGDEAVRLETTQNIERLDDKLVKLNEKVDNIDDKLDEIRADQAVIVKDSYKLSMDILKQLGEINRKVE